MRRRQASIVASPVLIGAVTLLVVIVAVFLAYNANTGLPFVPTYELRAEVPNAANLVVGNDVRIGGSRVGFVSGIKAEPRDDGSTIAVLDLSMERDVSPLPRDSTLIVRPLSALGLKYVEITRGGDEQGFADGATIPLAQATPAPVEFDEFTNMFDEPTRDAARKNLRGFGDALAGRGESLNTAIGAFRPLLRDDPLRVMRPYLDPLRRRVAFRVPRGQRAGPCWRTNCWPSQRRSPGAWGAYSVDCGAFQDRVGRG